MLSYFPKFFRDVPVLLHVNLGTILGGTGRCNMIGEKEKGNKNST